MGSVRGTSPPGTRLEWPRRWRCTDTPCLCQDSFETQKGCCCGDMQERKADTSRSAGFCTKTICAAVLRRATLRVLYPVQHAVACKQG